VMVGEPVTATASASNFNPKHTLSYSWASTGGKVTGKDNTATLDTNGVAGGSYTVTARVTDPKMKKGGEASCTATFTVKEPPKNPPTMSCSASPTSVQAGTPATVTCSCTSPDNVPVTVSGWTASGGSVSGEGNTATLNTTGASAGPITVSATCSDSRGLTASASSQVTVEVPPPPPPEASKLSECDFPNKVKPWRVDNTCKAVLDDVAQRLQHDPDAKLVIVGNAEPGEKRKNLAGERAVNSKAYLSGGEAKQAIDASRIEVRTGSAGTRTAEYWVVPAGATFSAPGTETVDESMVKAVPDHPVVKKKAR
jgi:outer membrane protein OmpA-like peptidoglycan-associated protein